MAFIQYISQASSDCLKTSYLSLLEQSGLNIPNELRNSNQLFAEFNSEEIKYKSKVNILLSWTNQREKEFSVEIWSDEPHSKKGSLCEKIHDQLSKIIPPKTF